MRLLEPLAVHMDLQEYTCDQRIENGTDSPRNIRIVLPGSLLDPVCDAIQALATQSGGTAWSGITHTDDQTPSYIHLFLGPRHSHPAWSQSIPPDGMVPSYLGFPIMSYLQGLDGILYPDGIRVGLCLPLVVFYDPEAFSGAAGDPTASVRRRGRKTHGRIGRQIAEAV